MEGFPPGSEKFLKKYTDFVKIPDLKEPANREPQTELSDAERIMFKEVLGQIEKGELTREKAFAMLTGISESFLEIHNSTLPMQERLNVQTIQNFMREYREWTREELLQFVNNPKNLPEFQKRPALTIALYNLLDKSRI